MNAEQKKVIKNTILECREILERDIEQVLINYGIYVDKNWINLRDLHFTEEQENTRIKIESAIEKLQKGGFDKNKAVHEYIKEVSYTNLNRLAALRVMEVHGLIDEILVTRVEYGNRSFISSRFYEVGRDYCRFEMDGGLTYLLKILFNEINEEIKMLFNMEDEYSFIAPSNGVLLKVIDLLCYDIKMESWKEDEIIGWIYQYFNDKEKDDVFDRLYNKKEKIRVEDIPAATQLFTPDWIVQWITDNSLGTLWEEIKEGKRERKRVDEIKLLDPCCGSGHFLVKAYDIFYNMYLEEGYYSKEEIPLKILEKNIFGIDIDLRAVQLTALILFIKTKIYLKNTNITTNFKENLIVMNLVCADSILLNGYKLEELKEKHKGNKIILEMIEIIYDEFEDVRLKGSLIQPEKKLFPLFDEFKNRIVKKELGKVNRVKKKQIEGQNVIEEEKTISLFEYKSRRDFSKEEKELLNSLNSIYNEAIKANDINKQLFASEAVKSIKLVDIFMQKNGYDVVVTNPPYLWRRNMTSKLKQFVEDNYKDWSTDLYSVFISRCLDFLNKKGKLGMITQQSFMFISSYENVRTEILDNYYVQKMVHLGPRAFDDISGEKVNTVMFVMENDNSNDKKSYFLRLFDEQTSTDKKRLLLNSTLRNAHEYFINQDKFKIISGSPFVYWINENIFNIFEENKPISQKYKVVSGMRIGANDKFLRFNWEIDRKKIGEEWKIYNKGGEFSRFYGEYKYVVDWRENALQYYSDNNAHRNQTMYFNKGVTYTLISSSGFSVRIIPDDAVFDAAGPSIFCGDDTRFYLCSFLNSSIISYLLKILNSTINYTPTDTNKLPYIEPTKHLKDKLQKFGELGYTVSKCKFKYKETSLNYEKNLLWEIIINNKNENFLENLNRTIYIKNLMKFIENKIITLVDEIMFELYKISNELKEKIKYKINDSIYKFEYIYKNYPLENDYDKLIKDPIEYCNNLAMNKDLIKELSIIYPIFNVDIINEIKDLISYYVFQIIQNSNDGILPMNSSIFSELDIVEKIYINICEDFGEKNADDVFEQIEKLLGISLDEYFIQDFFSNHIKNYEKRPVFWHICSPKKTFNCFIYYQKLNDDILYKVKSIYLGQMIDRYKDDLKYYTGQLIEARANSNKIKEKDFRTKCTDLESKLDDLYSLDKKIMEILPYKPDIDQGVLYNIIPLEPILSSSVSTDKEKEVYYKEVKK